MFFQTVVNHARKSRGLTVKTNKKCRISKLWLGLVGAIGLCSVGTLHAEIETNLFGGELTTTGFIRNETRYNMDNNYITGSIIRGQLEMDLKFEDRGIFDSLSFVAIIRPEFDVGYWNSGLTDHRVGRDASNPNYLGTEFTGASDPIGYDGFGAGLLTGGLSKNVSNGVWTPQQLTEFEVIAGGTGFPLLVPTGAQNMNCRNCNNVDNSHRSIAWGNTDSAGKLYPFRELYVDAVIEDWWFRIGKQQIVWGKTDFFRMQDIINPVDFGYHFFFDQFEDIRIPQWIARAQYKFGSLGFVNDAALEVVWNFDRFQGVGLGNPSQGWSHPFGQMIGTFASFNTYFSPEPCVSAANATGAGQTCVDGDGRLPSGFGVPVGLSEERIPANDLESTEFGLRFEFRLGDVRAALSYYYGWSDTPLFGFTNVNVIAAGAGFGVDPGLGNDALVGDLTLPFTIPVAVMEPNAAIAAAAANGDAGAIAALAQDNARLFYEQGTTFGGQVNMFYDQVHTLGLSLDYFEPVTGIVFRVESSYTPDEPVQNTRKATWRDESDVIRFSLGMDRPTFIPWLNKNRTFFLSAQIFDTYYLDHEQGANDGYIVGEHNFIYTFFAQTQYLRDQLIPNGFIVWEEESDSWVTGLTAEFLINNNWSIKAGTYSIWGGDRTKHDVGPFTSFTLDGNYAQHSVFGFAREGIGALRDTDEVFVSIRYQF